MQINAQQVLGRFPSGGRRVAWTLWAAILAAGPSAFGQVPPVAPGNQQPPGKAPNLTTDTGRPVGNDEHSMTAGPEGPTLLEHFYLIEKIARFDRERIPERVVHARGVGIQGEFVATADVTPLTKAAFLSSPGKKTPVFVRFSTVVLPKGSADSARDVRGFAVKFYTDEGNYDLVGNDIPVFFIRDAMKFPDLIHAFKPSPVTNVQEAERFFDFFSAMPESTHTLTWLFSDRGTPASFRQMDGFGVNAFKWVNAQGQVHYVKYKWNSLQGIKNNTDEQAKMIGGREPAALTQELYESINNGDRPSWELQVQALTPEELHSKFDFDPLDATKVWPESIVPFRTVGKMTLNKVPENFFQFTEQVAFNTGAYVPGVEPSEDKLLQGRNFSYSDTQRHRLGVNYQQLPVNQPRHPVSNDNQEGLDDHTVRKGDINYSPSTKRPDRMVADPRASDSGTFLGNKVFREGRDPQNYKQAGERYLEFSSTDRDHLVMNLTGEFKKVKNRDVVAKMIGHFARANEELGRKLAEANGVDLDMARKLVAAPR